MSPESFKVLRLTLEANKTLLEKWSGTSLTWFRALFPGEEHRLLPWAMAKEEPQDILGNLKDLRNSHKSIGVAGK